MIATRAAHTVATRWLDAFAGAVRARDYEAGAALFMSDVVAFGTLMTRADGIEALTQTQWRRIWEDTEDFTFEPGSLRVIGQDPIAIAVGFTSLGLPERARRHGRATYVLVCDGDTWRCAHSHHSLGP